MDHSNMKDDMSHDEQWDDTLLIQQYDATMEQLRRKAVQQMQSSSSGDHDSTTSPAKSSQAPAAPDASASSKKKNKLKKKKNPKSEWQVGHQCRCEFSQDGEIYEATVSHVNRDSGMATVTYVGYGNSEAVPLHKLLRSGGPAARQQQETEAGDGGGEWEHESGVGEDESSDCSSRVNAPSSTPSSRLGAPRSSPSRCGHSAATSRSTSHSAAFMPDGAGVLPDLPPPPPLGMALSGLDDSEMLHTLLMSWYMTGYHTGYYRGVRAARHRHRHH